MANLITIARIGLIIPFAACFLANADWNMTAALAIFVVAALSDFFDGYVARARGETSALGAALDPLADKLLISAALILLLRNGLINGIGVFAVLAIILRELTVSGLREVLGAQGKTLPVSFLAKWKTTVQLIACGLMLAAAPRGLIGDGLLPIATGVLWLAAGLTLWTGLSYTRQAFHMLSGKDTNLSS